MRKIVLTGPESTGKTTLAAQLASHFGIAWVPEFARGYLEKMGRAYQQSDLLEIAKGQIDLEEAAAREKTGILLCDTSLEVIKIWSEVVYGHCHPWISEQMVLRRADLYILCRPDLAWQADPLRENPYDRDSLYQLYFEELTSLNQPFVELTGQGDERFTKAVGFVQTFLKHMKHV